MQTPESSSVFIRANFVFVLKQHTEMGMYQLYSNVEHEFLTHLNNSIFNGARSEFSLLIPVE